jgi:putative ABC transport system permease protein
MAWLEDVRFGLRTFAKDPTFVLIAVLALALGIGANATVFAIADAVLFKNMPFVDDRILYLGTDNVSRNEHDIGVSWPDFRDWRGQVKSFSDLGAYSIDGGNLSDKDGLPARYSISAITANAFSMIGQKPIRGRDFTAQDESAGAGAVAILGYRIWQDRYGKDPAVLGKVIRINSVPTTVIGVMRDGLRFPIDTDLWTVLRPGADGEKREKRNMAAFGRLAPSAGPKEARAELAAISRNLERAYPETNQDLRAVVQSFSDIVTGPNVAILIGALMGAVGFVLLIACANVANLLLARAVDRSREISIRIALGAGRWRIIRQLLIESVMLSVVGGFCGWLISIWGIRVFDAAVRSQIPAWMNFSLDYRGFAYLAIISIGTGLAFGLAPALRLAGLDLNTTLKDGSRGSSSGARTKYLSGLLVVTEMALAVVLLTGAGLMIRSFLNTYNMQTGVNQKNVLVMRLLLPEPKYPHEQDQIAFHDRLKARLDALPGVDVSCISITMPTGGAMVPRFELEGAAPVDDKHRSSISMLVISPDYFRAMDVKVLKGRSFSEIDGTTGTHVAMVNQRFVEKFWPDEDPIGKRLRTYDDKKPEPWLIVVGVVPNILQNLENKTSARDHDPLIYVPYRQKALRDMALMARTRVPPNSLATAFRQAVATIDEDMPLYNVRSLEERLDINNWSQRIFGSLFGIFAAIALALASFGLYAVIAHSVKQRTQEIGLRMALGASSETILGLVFLQGMRQLIIGLVIGLGAAIGLTRVLNSLLVQVSARDPVTFLVVALVLAIAAILGCAVPARRAMQVDPVVALRHE